MVAVIGIAIASFAATNIDDLFVLLGFFAEPRFRAREIVAGQFLGMATLVGLSLLLGWAAAELTAGYVRYLGLLPIALGLKGIWELRRPPGKLEEVVSRGPGRSRVFTVAAVTLANGGDNIGVYAPLLSPRPLAAQALIVAVYMLMTGAWCLFARFLVGHPLLGKPLRLYGRYVFPFLLIGIGSMILRGA